MRARSWSSGVHGLSPSGRTSTWKMSLLSLMSLNASTSTSSATGTDFGASSLEAFTVTVHTDDETRTASCRPSDAVHDAVASAFGRPVGHIEEALFGDDAVQPRESFKELGIEVTVTPCCCLSPSPSPHTDSSSSDSLPLLCSCVAGRGEARRALQGGQGDGGGSGGRDD